MPSTTFRFRASWEIILAAVRQSPRISADSARSSLTMASSVPSKGADDPYTITLDRALVILR